MAISGFSLWVLGSESGTRWALVTTAQRLDGHAQGVRGTIWKGVDVKDLAVALPDMAINVKDFHLQANWRELFDTRLHLQELSAGVLQIDKKSSTDEKVDTAFEMPTLPVQVAIDRLEVGEFIYLQDGVPLPIKLGGLSAALSVREDGGQLVLRSLDVAHEQAQATLSGDVSLLGLSDPWPMKADIAIDAKGLTPDSPLCARRFLPTLPAGESQATDECTLTLNGTVEGSMESLRVIMNGGGQGMSADADVTLTPNAAFPLKNATVALQLADGSSLHSKVDWASTMVDDAMHDRLSGTLHTEKLDIGQLVGDAIPPAVITTDLDFDIQLRNRSELVAADLALVFAEGSRWNKQVLEGHLKTQINAAATQVPIWQGLQLNVLDMDLKLGKNHLQADGSLGTADSLIKLNLLAPDLASFWPDLPGGGKLTGQVAGTVASHKAELALRFEPGLKNAEEIGKAPVSLDAVVTGGWAKGTTEQGSAEGWRGTIQSLNADHAGIGLRSGAPTRVSFLPGVAAPAWQWQVGGGEIDVLLETRRLFTLAHTASRGGAGRWETQGEIASLPISPALIDELRKKLNLQPVRNDDLGGVKIRGSQKASVSEIVLALDWNLKFAGTLSGDAHIKRVSGDVMVPAEPPFALGLETLDLDLNAARASDSTSKVTAALRLTTKKMGRVQATASTLLRSTAGGGLTLNPKDVKTATIDATIDDLGWTSLFMDDAMELGGTVQANVNLKSKPDGSWDSGGTITGEKIRVIRIDDGIRLLDGTLSARLQNETLVLERLSFPALLRVTPKEWRTAEWVSTNPDAKGGSLVLSGEWNLFTSQGIIDIDLQRYPILQRADRYAMVTGTLRVAAELPKIAIKGSVVADAGWFDLDMLGGIPVIDGDVVVLRPGQEIKEVNAPTDLSLDLELDLGRRFYLTGYGVNSGLTGKLRIMMMGGKLTAIGALNTRGGAIEAYGQRLQLRRGSITFQGDITSPVLDIEALRTGLAVEAGVRVAGTAKRPRIDLVSYPAVSEIEKLSWLLMGHGPNESGGDMALLFSVGTSFLGSGEPFYRKFGVDEVSIKSGDLGAVGSILPAESVVSGLDSGTSDIERKFVNVSKALSNGITLSIQQALSDTGTVGRASYGLARGLTAEISAGTINGLALVYRWFSRD